MIDEEACEHVETADENITPKTSGCEECEKEGTEWLLVLLFRFPRQPVRVGDIIPVDGHILRGASTVNQSSITGECAY